MTNYEISKLLRNVAAVYSLFQDRFRVIAYEKAADSLENSTIEAFDEWKEGKLTSIPGIGSSLSKHLDEMFQKGKAVHFEAVLSKVPPSFFPLLDIAGLGPKKAYKLVTSLKLSNSETVLEDLLKAAKSGRIASIPGFGEKSQQDTIEALERFKKGQILQRRMSLPYADQITEKIISYLLEFKDTVKAESLGSLKRRVATIGDIDIAVATDNPIGVIEHFLKYPLKDKLIEKGPTGASIFLTSGYQIDLRVTSPSTYGSMLQYFTGSKNHNIKLREYASKKGFSLSEYGIKPIGKTQKSKLLPAQAGKSQNFNSKLKMFEFHNEEDFYGFLELPWIPPEMREDRGEIESAESNRLPKLINLKDIKGDFHIHSNYNLEPSHDLGKSSIEEIIKMADELDYEYIGISDHNPSVTNHTKEHVNAIMKRRRDYIEQIKKSNKTPRVNILNMLETDILQNGNLAIPKESLEYVDAIMVSVHSGFDMNKSQMTKRVLSGLSHPKAKVLCHPTGRLFAKREGYNLEWSEIFKFCKTYNKALEINAYPDRLDLNDILVKEAINEGVSLVIGTDSHEKNHMNLMIYGIYVARRGWSTKSDIINTLSYKEMIKWLLNE